ncbi:MAG: hypothetical protein VB055_03700 [Oscillospiraceae bacterium]|nr:hypothetical protein [Oscillospiraceae bacterium]
MDQLIERYVYDVTRRLPEKDRKDVGKELKSNIYDMLPDRAEEAEIKAVLYELGAPASLAEKYRQKPRYLISPAMYDDYVRVLKWVLPLVGVVVLVIGMILGAIDAIKDGMVDFSVFMSSLLKNGISMGVSAVFQALVWTTVGFAIAERSGARENKGSKQEWTIEALPDILPNDNVRIPLSDSIPELVLTVIFSVVVILMCSGTLPILFTIRTGDTQIHSLLGAAFLAKCVPAIAVTAFFSVCECIIKIKVRRWTPLVCGAVIVSCLVNMGVIFYLITLPDWFSTEFTAFLQSRDWGRIELLRFMGTPVANPVGVSIFIVVAVLSLVGCGHAVFRTLENKKQSDT